VELDAGGRRLRAALAAVLVRDNAPELRLMHDWLDWDVQLTAYAARRRRSGRGTSRPLASWSTRTSCY
jgi:hypothetical protein